MRYVIDFYNAAPEPGKPIGMHLDVRPALDSLDAVLDRIRMQWRWIRLLSNADAAAEPQRAETHAADRTA